MLIFAFNSFTWTLILLLLVSSEFSANTNRSPLSPSSRWLNQIRDGGHGFSSLLGLYCGDQFPPIITSRERRLWLRFHSDENIEYQGFAIIYEFIPRPTSCTYPHAQYYQLCLPFWPLSIQYKLRSNALCVLLYSQHINVTYEEDSWVVVLHLATTIHCLSVPAKCIGSLTKARKSGLPVINWLFLVHSSIDTFLEGL